MKATNAYPGNRRRRRSASPAIDLRIRTLWNGFRQESWPFYLLLFFVAWEYWRPQSVWPIIDVIPWGTVSVLLCAVGYLVGGERGRKMHPMDWLFIAFSVWVFISIPLGFDPAYSMENWAYMATWVFLYFLVSHIVLTPRRLLLFWLGFMVVNLKMSQHATRTWIGRGFSFQAWGVTGSPVWFQNSGEFAMGMVIFMAMSWCLLVAIRPYLGRWIFWIGVGLLPVTAAMSVLASSSRGGQLAALSVILVLLGASRAKWKGVVVAVVVLAAGWQLLPSEQKDRFASIGTDEDTTGELRLEHWRVARSVIVERPLMGLGYEGWMPYYRSIHPARVQQIHNTFLEAPVELGIPGALVFFSMILGSFLVNRRTRRRVRRLGGWGGVMYGMAMGLDAAMVGLMVASFFMSVLFWPVYWMAFALAVSLSETSRRTVAFARAQAARVVAEPAPAWRRPAAHPV